MNKKVKVSLIVFAVALIVFSIIASQYMTIFVIQPIGAVPEGKTLLLWGNKHVFTVWKTGGRGLFPFHEDRGKTTFRFIDNADAVCQRDVEPTLLCRSAVLGALSDNMTIVGRLSYSETLFRMGQ